MKYTAQLISMDDCIEEDMLVEVEGYIFHIFGHSPYYIEIGKKYPIEIDLQIFDDDISYQINSSWNAGFVRIGNGFGYIITGVYSNGTLKVGNLVFDLEDLPELYAPDNTIISLEVDRINAFFYEEIK